MPYLSIKLKNDINRILKQEPNPFPISFHLKNININGNKRGCNGFVLNEATGACVYVNTEKSVYGPLAEKSLCRYARDTKDYSSNSLGAKGKNEFVTDENLAKCIVKMLNV